jgi:hypothetical protein
VVESESDVGYKDTDDSFLKDVAQNKHAVFLTVRNKPDYMKKLRNHKSGNTKQGLFNLLMISRIEYRRDWKEDDSDVLRYVTRKHAKLMSFGIEPM